MLEYSQVENPGRRKLLQYALGKTVNQALAPVEKAADFLEHFLSPEEWLRLFRRI